MGGNESKMIATDSNGQKRIVQNPLPHILKPLRTENNEQTLKGGGKTLNLVIGAAAILNGPNQVQSVDPFSIGLGVVAASTFGATYMDTQNRRITQQQQLQSRTPSMNPEITQTYYNKQAQNLTPAPAPTIVTPTTAPFIPAQIVGTRQLQTVPPVPLNSNKYVVNPMLTAAVIDDQKFSLSTEDVQRTRDTIEAQTIIDEMFGVKTNDEFCAIDEVLNQVASSTSSVSKLQPLQPINTTQITSSSSSQATSTNRTQPLLTKNVLIADKLFELQNSDSVHIFTHVNKSIPFVYDLLKIHTNLNFRNTFRRGTILSDANITQLNEDHDIQKEFQNEQHNIYNDAQFSNSAFLSGLLTVLYWMFLLKKSKTHNIDDVKKQIKDNNKKKMMDEMFDKVPISTLHQIAKDAEAEIIAAKHANKNTASAVKAASSIVINETNDIIRNIHDTNQKEDPQTIENKIAKTITPTAILKKLHRKQPTKPKPAPKPAPKPQQQSQPVFKPTTTRYVSPTLPLYYSFNDAMLKPNSSKTTKTLDKTFKKALQDQYDAALTMVDQMAQHPESEDIYQRQKRIQIKQQRRAAKQNKEVEKTVVNNGQQYLSKYMKTASSNFKQPTPSIVFSQIQRQQRIEERKHDNREYKKLYPQLFKAQQQFQPILNSLIQQEQTQNKRNRKSKSAYLKERNGW